MDITLNKNNFKYWREAMILGLNELNLLNTIEDNENQCNRNDESPRDKRRNEVYARIYLVNHLDKEMEEAYDFNSTLELWKYIEKCYSSNEKENYEMNLKYKDYINKYLILNRTNYDIWVNKIEKMFNELNLSHTINYISNSESIRMLKDYNKELKKLQWEVDQTIAVKIIMRYLDIETKHEFKDVTDALYLMDYLEDKYTKDNSNENEDTMFDRFEEENYVNNNAENKELEDNSNENEDIMFDRFEEENYVNNNTENKEFEDNSNENEDIMFNMFEEEKIVNNLTNNRNHEENNNEIDINFNNENDIMLTMNVEEKITNNSIEEKINNENENNNIKNRKKDIIKYENIYIIKNANKLKTDSKVYEIINISPYKKRRKNLIKARSDITHKENKKCRNGYLKRLDWKEIINNLKIINIVY